MRIPVAVAVLGAAAASVTSAQVRHPVTLAPPASARIPVLAERLSYPGDSARTGPNYVLPALEILAFNGALNLFDRAALGAEYRTNLSSIRRNLRRKWVVDNDPFDINQFLHPYQGSINQTFARSTGVSYWGSLAYSVAGSALWEIAGETVPPSKNDLIASGIAGTFLGEAVFRLSNLILENAGGTPNFWRTLAAAAISPSTEFSRGVFGRRFDAVFSSRGAAYYRRLEFGVSGTSSNVFGGATKLRRNEGLINLAVDYGLPGITGYVYHRPFDYFAIQATGSSANGLENILTRGLLVGTGYGAGGRYRGVWGLYGSYDYVAPQIFRVSSTALSLGTTGQRILSKAAILQTTLLGGAGYAAVGTLHGTGDRDYHYGVAPQGLFASRLIVGDRASLDLTAHEYFVSGVAAASTGGHDNIVRADASLSVRIHRQRAIAVRYQWTRRDAVYPGLDSQHQLRATLGIFYSLLGHDRFGAVDWR